VKEGTKKWLRAAGVRAVKTFAQTAAATIGVGATMGSADWAASASAAAAAAILSLLTSMAGLPEIKEETDERN